jgi:hypothetical protein
MNTKINPWNELAATAAHALAEAHGHGWVKHATYCYGDDGSYLDYEATCAKQNEAEKDLPPALKGLPPLLEHTTTTGRVWWRIKSYRSGETSVELEVRRPLTVLNPLAVGMRGHVVVLRTTVWIGDGELRAECCDAPCRVGQIEVNDLAEDRHLWALATCLWAVLGEPDGGRIDEEAGHRWVELGGCELPAPLEVDDAAA